MWFGGLGLTHNTPYTHAGAHQRRQQAQQDPKPSSYAPFPATTNGSDPTTATNAVKPRSSKPCKYLLQGRCRNGGACRFAHPTPAPTAPSPSEQGEEGLGTAAPIPPPPAPQQQQRKQPPNQPKQPKQPKQPAGAIHPVTTTAAPGPPPVVISASLLEAQMLGGGGAPQQQAAEEGAPKPKLGSGPATGGRKGKQQPQQPQPQRVGRYAQDGMGVGEEAPPKPKAAQPAAAVVGGGKGKEKKPTVCMYEKRGAGKCAKGARVSRGGVVDWVGWVWMDVGVCACRPPSAWPTDRSAHSSQPPHTCTNPYPHSAPMCTPGPSISPPSSRPSSGSSRRVRPRPQLRRREQQ